MGSQYVLAGCLATLAVAIIPFGAIPAAADTFSEQRTRMVREQIVARGLHDGAMLEAMLSVPRHEFVPKDLRSRSYGDHPLPIGHHQTISQPYIVAYMSEALDLKPGQKVLEIGTGSGYQAAVLAEMGAEVYSIEIVKPLAEQARIVLERLKYEVGLRCGDGYAGWPEAAPFDAIIVTAAPPRIPEPLVEQLREGGRMVIPVDVRWGQELQILNKVDGEMVKARTLPVRFVPMTGRVNERAGDAN